jgi:hypothetical protein
MKPRLFLLACAAGLLAAPAASAAPAPEGGKDGGPAIVVQVRSIDHLLDTVKTTAKNFLPDPMYKDFEKDVLGKLDLNFIKGVDTKKPIGAYASLDAGLLQGDFSKSSLVVLIPVTDEADFVALLGKIDIKVEKRGDVYSIAVPNSPLDISMRFLKGYAYLGFAGEKLDPKKLLDPKEIISEKETAAVVLRVRMDRVPDELKKAGVEFFTNMFEGANAIGMPPALKEIYGDYMKLALRRLRMGIEDGKEIAYRIDLDPKTGALAIEFVVEAKPNTALAKSVHEIKPTKNDFAGIVGSDSAGHALFSVPLFMDDVKDLLLKVIDVGTKEAPKNLGDAPAEVKDLVREALKTAERTVKGGTLDFAASLRGPDKNDQYTAVAALSAKDTAPLEKAIKAALKVAPNEVTGKVKLDSYKVGEVNVHEILVADLLPAEPQKIFGKTNVHVALAPEAVVVTFGARAQSLMKEVLTAKASPKPAPLLHAEVSGKRLVSLIKNAGLPMDDKGKPFLEKLGTMERIAVLSIKLRAEGDKLICDEEIGVVPLALMFWTVARSESRPAFPPQPVPAPKAVPPAKR